MLLGFFFLILRCSVSQLDITSDIEGNTECVSVAAEEVVVLDVNPFMSLFNFIICFIACLFVCLPFKRIYVFVLNSFLNKIYIEVLPLWTRFSSFIPSSYNSLRFYAFAFIVLPQRTNPSWN